ncbi:MAG: CPBP family intramembrane metalloprotease [Elusimicrobia bacterium]|nr:CPBP family intramembrane metalloprotease [Elusimicrobiota bacterium]
MSPYADAADAARPRARWAILCALAIAGAYWPVRQALVARMPISETRRLTPAEIAALPRGTPGEPIGPDREGWSIVYTPQDVKAGTRVLTIWTDPHGFRPRMDWWLKRDLCWAVLRIAGLLACLLAARAAGGARLWGWKLSWSWKGAALMAAVAVAFLLRVAGGEGPLTFNGIPAWTIAGLNLPVGFFEEACFRGLLFLGLARILRPRAAAIVSSVIFALWHWGVQPAGLFGQIFFFGLCACAALYAGLGLGFLALAHAALDTAMMSFQRAMPSWYEPLGSLTACLVCGAIAMAMLRARDRSAS